MRHFVRFLFRSKRLELKVMMEKNNSHLHFSRFFTRRERQTEKKGKEVERQRGEVQPLKRDLRNNPHGRVQGAAPSTVPLQVGTPIGRLGRATGGWAGDVGVNDPCLKSHHCESESLVKNHCWWNSGSLDT